MYIQNNIGKFFIDLVGRHFNDPLLGKLFKKINLKEFYSCVLRSWQELQLITRRSSGEAGKATRCLTTATTGRRISAP